MYDCGNYLKSRIFESINDMDSNEDRQFLRMLLHQPIVNIHRNRNSDSIQIPIFKDGILNFITVSSRYSLIRIEESPYVSSINNMYFFLSYELFSWLSKVVLDYDIQKNNTEN